MTHDAFPDSGLGGSGEAGTPEFPPGESDLGPDDRALLDALRSGGSAPRDGARFPEDSEDAARAAADDRGLPGLGDDTDAAPDPDTPLFQEPSG